MIYSIHSICMLALKFCFLNLLAVLFTGIFWEREQMCKVFIGMCGLYCILCVQHKNYYRKYLLGCQASVFEGDAPSSCTEISLSVMFV